MGFRGSDTPDIKVKENMNKSLCKKLDGEVLELSDGTEACVFPRDPDSGEPVDVNLENVTPEVQKKVKEQTGKELDV